MKTHEEEMTELLTKMGVTEAAALAKVLVEAAVEQERQWKMYGKEFDDTNNSYEWSGYVMKTLGSGLAGYPTDPALFRTKSIHAVALLFGAAMAIDRNPENLIQKRPIPSKA